MLVLLGAQEGIEVAGEVVDGRDAVEKAAALRPDVVLMDVRMPVLNELEATRLILGDQHRDAGVSGFLLKDASAQMLAEAVRVVAAGDAMLSPPVTRRLLGTFARLGGPRGPTRDQVDRLTERETEALTLIARGRSNAEIAEDLVVAEQTVKTHVRRILASWASGTGPRRPSSPTRPAWCGRTATRAEQLLGRCLTVGDGDDPARTTPQRGLGQRSPGSPCSTGVMFGPGRQRGMADRRATELDVPGDEVSLGDLDRHVSNIERHHMAVILAGQGLTR